MGMEKSARALKLVHIQMPRCVGNDLKSIFSTSLRVIGDVGISSSADDGCG